jgi:hypothetical protein
VSCDQLRGGASTTPARCSRRKISTIEQLDRELGGKRLQEIAIAVLEREIQPGQAVHYRDWYALLCAAGYRARGKDPLASFLAQINRAEQVEPIGERSGRYRLRAA